MRKELRGALARGRVILRFGEWISQRASVEKDGEFARAEKALKLAAAGMEAVAVAIAIDRRNRKERALWNGKHRSSDSRVIIVLRCNGRNDQIVRVISAPEKNANKRFVVVDVTLGDGCIHE